MVQLKPIIGIFEIVVEMDDVRVAQRFEHFDFNWYATMLCIGNPR